MFYPANPDQLREMVRSYLRQAKVQPGPSPKALITPHAGFVYSGPIAASAFAQWLPDRELIKRIILLGPSHRVALTGVALSPARTWSTPLGIVEQDLDAGAQIKPIPNVTERADAHLEEHSLEVELPFLQVVLDHFSIVPLVVGEDSQQTINDCLQALWGGPETRIVISSDLSHYQDYASARMRDQVTAAKIEQLSCSELAPTEACGCNPVSGFLQLARLRQLHGRILDLRNSGDTAGSHGRVVGYGAFAFYEPTDT